MKKIVRLSGVNINSKSLLSTSKQNTIPLISCLLHWAKTIEMILPSQHNDVVKSKCYSKAIYSSKLEYSSIRRYIHTISSKTNDVLYYFSFKTFYYIIILKLLERKIVVMNI